MPDIERKGLSLDLKADKPGSVSAIFSTLNTIDHDSDVTLPGAFEDGASVRMLPAHDWAHYMIGNGVIRPDQQRAVFDGHFNLKTTAGRDWYESVKDGADLQEWSYGFSVLDSSFGEFQGQQVRFLRKLAVHEVSPVTLGAGIGTRVLSIKNLKDGHASFEELFAYFDEHPDEATAFLNQVMDGKAVWSTAFVNNLPDSAFAFIESGGKKDDEGKTVPRSLRHFPHHDTSGDPDAPHVRNGLARVEQWQASDADKAKARNHLRAHADSMNIGKAADSDDGPESEGQKFAHQAEHVLADVQAFVARAAGIAALRAKEGRTFSAANVGRLQSIADEMATSAAKLRELLTQSEPAPKSGGDPLSDIQRELDRFRQLQTLYATAPATA